RRKWTRPPNLWVNGISNCVTRGGGPSRTIFRWGRTVVCDDGHSGIKKSASRHKNTHRRIAPRRSIGKPAHDAVPVQRSERKRGPPMRPQRDDHLPAMAYGSVSLEQIQEGVSAEAVSYAAGLLVEAIRNYESKEFGSVHQELTLTEAQMIAANVI